MTKLTLRSLGARKLRTALTAMAIVLGVSMISGTYVLTDTIDRAFGDIFQQAAEGIDVAVTPGQEIDSENEAQEVPLDGALLERVRSTPGVEDAVGSVFSSVAVLKPDGDPIRTSGVPMFAASVAPDEFEPFEAVEGRLPTADDEAAIDQGTADDEGFEVGDTLSVVGDPGTRRYRLVGVAKYGTTKSLAGATVVLLNVKQAQEMTDRVDRFDEISAKAADGVSAAQLRDRVKESLRGEQVDVRTGQENADQEQADMREDFGFLRTALLVFAGIALFVGAFVIYNTFSITVAQRTKELALLRTMGASRRQVLRSVVLEALVVGGLAAVVGLVGGLLVSRGIVALFSAIGFDLPTGDTVIATRTIVVSLLVGVVVTTIASVVPALRATRVAPIAALRDVAVPTTRMGRLRLVFAGILGAAGLAILVGGLFAGGGATAGLLGLGAALIFIATALLTPKLVPPLASAAGAPLQRLGGLPGRLARENAARNPGRTAATAAALMIGLALVTFVTIFAAGFRGTIDESVDRSFAGDLTVRNKDGFSPIPKAIRPELQRLSEVELASGVRFTNTRVLGAKETDAFVVGVDPTTLDGVYNVQWKEGDDGVIERMGPDDVIVDHNWGKDNGLGVGDTAELLTTSGKRVRKKVVAELDEGGTGLLGGGLLVTNEALERDWDQQRDAFIFVKFRDGVDAAQGRKQVDTLLDGEFPIAEAQDREEVKDAQAGMINQLLGMIYALLGLSVIVSLFGIVNTLALSIHERTRELGMLRAIGTSKRQVRRTVRYESAITAMIGAVLGLVLGTIFAVIVSRPLADEGFTLTIPGATLVGLLILAMLAGVLAAIGPARRAAKVDVLKALAYE